MWDYSVYPPIFKEANSGTQGTKKPQEEFTAPDWTRLTPRPGGTKASQSDVIRTLRLHNLPDDASERDIRSIFPAKMRVSQIRIARDVETGKCVGYGFVEFETKEVANEALESMQGVRYPGRSRAIEFGWAQANTGAPVTAYQVYVGNLSHEVTDLDLLRFFRQFTDKAISAKVILEPGKGVSSGFGFVRFRDFEDAKSVVSRVSKSKPKLGQFPLTVRLTYPNDNLDKDNTTIYVSSLSPSVTEEDLTRTFSAFGKLDSMRYLYMRNVAFVTYVRHISALAALSHLQDYKLRGQKMMISWGRQKRQQAFRVALESLTDHDAITKDQAYSHEWHRSMQPQVKRPMTKPEAAGAESAPASDEDRRYWLSLLVPAGSSAGGALATPAALWSAPPAEDPPDDEEAPMEIEGGEEEIEALGEAATEAEAEAPQRDGIEEVWEATRKQNVPPLPVPEGDDSSPTEEEAPASGARI